MFNITHHRSVFKAPLVYKLSRVHIRSGCDDGFGEVVGSLADQDARSGGERRVDLFAELRAPAPPGGDDLYDCVQDSVSSLPASAVAHRPLVLSVQMY